MGPGRARKDTNKAGPFGTTLPGGPPYGGATGRQPRPEKALRKCRLVKEKTKKDLFKLYKKIKVHENTCLPFEWVK
jgi:hypothetical protein